MKGRRALKKNGCLIQVLACVFLFACLAPAHAQSTYDALIQQGKTQLQVGNSAAALATGQQAIQVDANRWEAYALAGGALMNLKRYEEAADDFSLAIQHGPEAKQDGLRNLRRQCVLAETVTTPSLAQTAAPPPAQSTTTQAEVVLWESIKNSRQQSDFAAYLSQYPNGAFAVLAKQHLADLQAQDELQQESVRAQAEKQRAMELADSDPTWLDPATKLMWQKQNSNIHAGWKKVAAYCSELRLEGFSDWRMPTIDELQGIYDETQNVDGRHVKGGLHLGGWEWSGTVSGSKAYGLDFTNGQSGLGNESVWSFGFCVRGTVNASLEPAPPILHRK
jgi:tetratricopeptide (TPR) repeat protein